MTRFLPIACLSLLAAACTATPDQAARDNRPNDYLTVGARAMSNATAGPNSSPPGITESSAAAGSDRKSGLPESYYGVAPLPGKVPVTPPKDGAE